MQVKRSAIEDAPAREQPVPVVDVAANERQALGDVHEALGEPHAHHAGLEEPSVHQEMKAARSGKEELSERPTEEMDRLAEQAEEDVAPLMEEEIHPVEKMVLVREDEPGHVEEGREEEESLREHVL